MKGIIYKAWTGLRKLPRNGEAGTFQWPNPGRSHRPDKPIDCDPWKLWSQGSEQCGRGGRLDLGRQGRASTQHL